MQKAPATIDASNHLVTIEPGARAQDVYDFVQDWLLDRLEVEDVFGQRENHVNGAVTVYSRPPWEIRLGNELSPLPPHSVLMLKPKDEPAMWLWDRPVPGGE
jgi:hypothetical protein